MLVFILLNYYGENKLGQCQFSSKQHSKKSEPVSTGLKLSKLLVGCVKEVLSDVIFKFC